MMSALIDAALGRSRVVLAALVFILVAGLYAYRIIPKESSPDVNIPNIYVSMSLEGISPDDAERLLLRPMEQELATIEGIKEMKSSAYQGGGFVLLEFKAGFNKDNALDDVQKGVDKARSELPDGVEEPDVREVNFSLFPVLVVTLSGNIPERTLLRLARDLQDKIESLPTVLEANIAGNRDELVEIIVDPELIESYNLNGPAILDLFMRSNRLVAAGSLDTGAGRFGVEVPGLFETVRDMMGMPIHVSGDSAIKVRDIAEIRRTFKDPESFARLNGESAIALEIVKRSGENIIDTIESVRRTVEAERTLWPAGIQVTYTQDESKHIRNMLSDLQNNLISAVILVMIVIIWSLGVRAAGLVGVSIPVSFLSGILILYAMGLTVNIVVLFSLILSVGMLVDGAIIVTEYADRKMAEGMHRKEAYIAAAKRMAWPVTTSVATTLAAFFPLLFWPGVVGQFMQYMPITLIAVMVSSLVTALVFLPVLGSYLGKPDPDRTSESIRMLALAEKGDLDEIKGFIGGYIQILKRLLRRPGLVLAVTALLLLGSFIAYGQFGRGVEFFPDIEPEVGSVLIHARGNLSIYEQDRLVREVEERILDIDGVDTFYTRVGKSSSHGQDLSEDVIGVIQMQFGEWNERRKAAQIMADIRSRTADISGLIIETQEAEEGPPNGKPVQIQIESRYPELLAPAVATMRSALEEIGDFTDVEDSRPLPGIDWELRIDRAQASKYGLDISTIGQYVRMVTNGLKVAEYRPDDSDDEIDIVLRHDVDRRTLNQLDRVRIEGTGGAIPIGNFAERVPKPKVGVINRAGQRRIMMVKADIAHGSNATEKVDDIRRWLAENPGKVDQRVNVKFKGEDEDQRESQAFLIKAFIMAIFIMTVLMVTQFNSFYSAFLVMSAVVLSTIGVLVGLILTQQPFGIVMSGIGVIALAGIIVHNNIILIDTFDHMRRDYGAQMSIREIILRTGAQRLRPVILTAVTTILGLLPMVLMLNIDFVARDVAVGAPSTQWWVQLSTAIVFGLTFSSILTLIVTPCALMFREKISGGFKRVKRFIAGKGRLAAS